MAEWLPEAGIDYRWEERLGGRRRRDKTADPDADAWWRVVHADGSPATCHGGTAVEHLLADGVPLTGRGRVDMSSAVAATPLA